MKSMTLSAVAFRSVKVSQIQTVLFSPAHLNEATAGRGEVLGKSCRRNWNIRNRLCGPEGMERLSRVICAVEIRRSAIQKMLVFFTTRRVRKKHRKCISSLHASFRSCAK
jgi:hypothetical protein